MRLKRLLISAVAVLGLSALGSSAHAAAPTASGAGHDQIAGKGKSTFTLIYRGSFRGRAIRYRGGFGRSYAFAGRPAFHGGVRRAYWGGGRYWGGAGWRRAGWYGGLGRPYGWGWRRAGWYGGWRRPDGAGVALAGGAAAGAGPLAWGLSATGTAAEAATGIAAPLAMDPATAA